MSGWTWRAPNEITGIGLGDIDAFAWPRSPSRSTGRACRGWRSRTARTGDSEPGSGGRPPSARSCRRRRATRSGVSAGSLAGENVAEQVLGLLDPAHDRVLAGEELHRDERVEALRARGCSPRGRNRRRPSRPTGSRGTDGSDRGPSGRPTHVSSPPSRPRSAGSSEPIRPRRLGRRWVASVAYGSGRLAGPSARIVAGSGTEPGAEVRCSPGA